MVWNNLLARILVRVGIAPASIITIGPGAGLRFDPGPSNADYASGNNELPVQHALVSHLHAGSVFYDVGANVGFLAVIGARLVGPQGLVCAFEPVPANAKYIQRNAKFNNFSHLRVFEKAVSNHCGPDELNLAKYSGGAALISVEAPPDPDGILRVDAVSIDAAIDRYRLRPPSLVKIDVEGAELEVLAGMEETVRRYRPTIIVEVDAVEAGLLQRRQADCDDWLRSRGYKVAALPDSYSGIEWLVRHLIATSG